MTVPKLTEAFLPIALFLLLARPVPINGFAIDAPPFPNCEPKR